MRSDRLCSAALALLVLACSGEDMPRVQTEKVELRVDDAVLSGDDAFAIVEPVYWSANIYGSLSEYEASLERFSRPQRLLNALHWYIAEVNNGGHEQFYSNSTGIVWPDALAAFEAIGVPDGAEILRESAQRLGGAPAREQDERNRQLAQRAPDFGDLDDRFYTLQGQVDLNARMLEYARSQPGAFEFAGAVERATLGGPAAE